MVLYFPEFGRVEGSMRRLGLALLLTESCLMVPHGAHAQRPATLAGNIYYEDDYHPAKNVLVNLSDSERMQLGTEQTNDAGRFRFSGLQRTTYTISVNASGYEPVTLQVDISFTSDKGVNIYLKPIQKKEDAQKPGSISTHELSMPAKARDLVESGKKKLYEEKNAAAGLADFQQAISLAPGYYEAHYQLAMAYLSQGNSGEAEKSFRKSIEVSDDKYGEAQVGLGTMMLDRGDFSDGEKTIRLGIQLNPNFWLGYYELGRALLNEKRLPEAQDSAEHARLLAPNAAMVYRLLSNIHLQQRNYPALLQDIDQYLKLDPDSPAGLRAKELREQVQQKIAAEHAVPATAKP
jgi:tetratricopeptide (TPR) repeat protein